MRDTTLVQEFLLVPELSDLPQEHLEWLAAQAEDRRFLPNQVLIREGDPAKVFSILLEGEVRFQRLSAGPGSPVYISRAPEIGGVLPLSRMKTFTVGAVAVTAGRVALMSTSIFPEMLRRMPELNQRLASIMADRIREISTLEQQHEKLMALGKLASGLAHELNNPAAAARRAAKSVGDSFLDGRKSTLRLGELGYPDFAWRLLYEYEQAALMKGAGSNSSGALERNDREERIAVWLEEHSVAEAWRIAAALADWELDLPELNDLAAKCPAKYLAEVLLHISSVLTSERLLGEVHSSLVRISELVSAVKDYTFMDQRHVQEVDVHDGIEATLTMLRYRMSEGIQVVREFDRSLPRICVQGGALNQVWTGLIENALDAMGTRGELRVRTAREADCALVEICDNGPGVPETIRGKIFDPFFTTKGVGQGTGLGLDIVRKILWNHNGSVAMESKPGDTRFQVRLPFSQAFLSALA